MSSLSLGLASARDIVTEALSPAQLDAYYAGMRRATQGRHPAGLQVVVCGGGGGGGGTTLHWGFNNKPWLLNVQLLCNNNDSCK